MPRILTGKYHHAELEQKWQSYWLDNSVFKWEKDSSRKETFSIDTPPPTVSGLLHMGHIYSYTQTDFIARFQRMLGKTVFYPVGFDDNGLPTERLVEKTKKIKASKLPRQEFVEICKEVVDEAEVEFESLFQSMGLSMDWEQKYQTVSPESAGISQMSFLDLYQKDLVERRYTPTFWDPVDQTAIAQAEIEDHEKTGTMYEIIFQLTTGEQIDIATTRPELLPACVAILYNPEDGRYSWMQDAKAITPIFGEEVPVIADEDVDPSKGTGLVMCCTFGDIQDIKWWKKYNLNLRTAINKEGRVTEIGKFAEGLKVNEAKEKVAEELRLLNLIKSAIPVIQHVKCAERSKSALEIIPTYQWYVKLLENKDKIKERSLECNWYPNSMKIRLDNWIDGLNQDWCISRQRYFGVPFPIWYSKRKGEVGKIIIADKSLLPIDPLHDVPPGYTKDEVTPDMDVMDTWATSAVSPQLLTGTINNEFSADNEDRHNKLYPFDLRPQAHEIIRTWCFYSTVKSLYHQDSIPWYNIMISGWCLAADKTKMSKSKGNVITPRNLIDSKGADSIRYWASHAKLGVDIIYSEDTFKIAKKLITKLWNASKFVSMHLEKLTTKVPIAPKTDIEKGYITEPLDIWILSKLAQSISSATANLKQFNYYDARAAAEQFFWNDFCDNYLELVKARVYNKDGKYEQGEVSALFTLYHCLLNILKLFAPFIPHIVEEIYQFIFEPKSSIHSRDTWPKLEEQHADAQLVETGEHIIKLMELVRKYKTEENLALNAKIGNAAIIAPNNNIPASLLDDFMNAAHINELKYLDNTRDTNVKSDCGAYGIKIL